MYDFEIIIPYIVVKQHKIKKEPVSEKKNSQTKPDVITGDLKTAVKEKNTNAHLTNGLAGPQVYIEQPVFKKVRSIINKT